MTTAAPGTGHSFQAFIDTHVHFWDTTSADVSYDWLAPNVVHPILGDIEPIKSVRYDADSLYAEGRFAGLTKAVHIQAAVGTADPVAETRWVDAVADSAPIPIAIIAHASLARNDVADQLAAHSESPRMRGVRDFEVEQILAAGSAEALDRGLKALAGRKLVLDVDCEWPNMAEMKTLAQRHPDVTMLLEHIGYPRSRDADYFNGWKNAISDLARADNVNCKISGLGMNHPRWTAEAIQPWIDHCLQEFGPSRCVLGSNWPVDRMYSSYDAIVGTYMNCLSEYSRIDQHGILVANAERLYRF